MRQTSRSDRIRSRKIFPFLLRTTFFAFILSAMVLGQGEGQDPSEQDKTTIDFQERLRFYLDQQTQNVVEDLLAREIQLLQLIQNVHEEISLRGKESVLEDHAGFETLYARGEMLKSEYAKELDRLLEISSDFDRLQRVAEYGGDFDNYQELLRSKQQIHKALDDRALYHVAGYSPERAGAMIDEYAVELDTLIGMFETLDWLKVQAAAHNDERALAEIQEQQTNIFKVLSKWRDLGPLSDDDFSALRFQIQQVDNVVQEIDDSRKNRSLGLSEELSQVKKDLLNNLDKSIVDFLSQSGYSISQDEALSNIIKAWESERYADVKARYAEYQVINTKLVASAQDHQRERMFSREVNTAMLNYADGRFRAAEYQFQETLDLYGKYYGRLTPLHYYIAECRYHRMAFDAAKESYQVVLADSVLSPYYAETLVRMMQLENQFGSSQNVFRYYGQLLQIDSLATPDLVAYAHYLVANKYFDRSQFTNARDVLLQVPAESRFFLPAQLLLGVVYTNLNDYDRAMVIFEELSQKKNYPWTSVNVAHIRNTALTRLGMIYYQRGEYVKAEDLFSQVSKGYENYDAAIIGQAWSNLQRGNLDAALERSHALLKNYLASDFTYEALVLSAHCKRLLNQPETAMNSYRYVVRARGLENLHKKYDSEREQVLDQVKQINRLEQDALEGRQEELYQQIDNIKKDLNEYLLKIKEKSDTGTQLIQDYYDERTTIVDRLSELDAIEDWANLNGMPDVAYRAAEQRARLVKVLETYRADEDVTNTAFLMDYPLAAKESGMIFQREKMASTYSDLNMEKDRIEQSLGQLGEMKREAVEEDSALLRSDLELLEFDLNSLRDRLSQFKLWAVENRPQDPQSNIDYWSDYSGLGMSDIVYELRKKRRDEINNYADQLKTVEDAMESRRQEIEQKLEQFEKEIRELQDRLISRKIQLEQLEKQTYFDNYYFENKEKEEESWEEKLKYLSQQK
jgi:TolA-binding protein